MNNNIDPDNITISEDFNYLNQFNISNESNKISTNSSFSNKSNEKLEDGNRIITEEEDNLNEYYENFYNIES